MQRIMNKLDRILFNAIYLSDEIAVKDAILKGANVNALDENGSTPLMVATILKTDLKILNFLVESGANINTQNPYGNTAVMFAAIIDKSIFRYLSDLGADTTLRNRDGRNALDYLRKFNILKVVENC